jgi:hypothetical protein
VGFAYCAIHTASGIGLNTRLKIIGSRTQQRFTVSVGV